MRLSRVPPAAMAAYLLIWGVAFGASFTLGHKGAGAVEPTLAEPVHPTTAADAAHMASLSPGWSGLAGLRARWCKSAEACRQ